MVEPTGAGPFEYRWRRNGQDLSNGGRVTGADSSVITITAVELTDGGSYTVLVKNSAIAIESDIAVVRIESPGVPALPFADVFAEAGELPAVDGAGTASNAGSGAEAGEPLHAGKSGGTSMWVSWTAPADGVLALRTLGSSFDTLLAVYEGDSIADLMEVAADDDGGEYLSGALRFNAEAGRTYRIAVDGFDGATGDFGLQWSFEPGNAVPSLTTLQQPGSVTVAPGESAVFTAAATGLGLSFQWYRNGVALAGETGASLTLDDVEPGDAGWYTVEIATPDGESIVSRPATLDVGSDPVTLFVDKRADAIRLFEERRGRVGLQSLRGFVAPVIGLPNFHTTDNSLATIEIGESLVRREKITGSLWVVFQAEVSGTLRLNTEGSEIETLLSLHRLREEIPIAEGEGTLAAVVENGGHYLLRVAGKDDQRGLIRIEAVVGDPPTITRRAPARVYPRSGETIRLWVEAAFVVAPELGIQAIWVDPDGVVHFRIEGTVGAEYELLTTTDLKTWTRVADLVPSGVVIEHSAAMDGPARFYRIVGPSEEGGGDRRHARPVAPDVLGGPPRRVPSRKRHLGKAGGGRVRGLG